MCKLSTILNPMGALMGKSKFGSKLEKLNPMSYLGKSADKMAAKRGGNALDPLGLMSGKPKAPVPTNLSIT